MYYIIGNINDSYFNLLSCKFRRMGSIFGSYFAIPLWILSLGLLTMATPRPEDAEERVKEPFTGY